MELKKCARCGCFFLAENDVCCNCEAKDSSEMFRLKTYIEENEIRDFSIQKLAKDTEISAKNVYRYLSQEDFKNSIQKMEKKNTCL